MPTFTTEVEIHISPDDFSDEELIEAIGYRKDHMSGRHREEFVRDVIAAVSGNSGVMSLEDAIKREMFEKHIKRISINDLDQFLEAL